MAKPEPLRKPPAVVVGLDCITGLQTARILARRGAPVIGVAKNPRHYCCRTRVCQRILTADTAGEELIGVLAALGPTLPDKAVLFPCTDLSVLQISRHRERLIRWHHIKLPPHDVVEALLDKMRFLELAQRRGWAIPPTAILRSAADARRAAEELPFPCVVKPPVKTPAWERHTKVKAYRVESPQELLALYARCASWAEVLLAQAWVPGPESNLYSCNCYYNAQGEPLATFIARKLRQWPPQTGTSCLGEECRNDAVLAESLRLFDDVGYCGLGYVEMKRDERDGRHWLIEPNVGRPTGRSAIAEAGGVELLYTMYCDAAGLPLPENRTQTYGHAKWIYWRRDFQAAARAWRRGELTLADWARSWRGRKTCAVFSWSDPLPFLADFAGAARQALALLGRRRTESPPALSPSSPHPGG